jgi:hypothetical protein
LGIEELQPRDRIGKLNSTLGAITFEDRSPGQGTPQQTYPEVYIGPDPNYPLLVNRAWKAMDKRWRPIVEVHYVCEGEKVRYKAEHCRITVSLYWKYLTFGKNYINGFVQTHMNYKATESVEGLFT